MYIYIFKNLGLKSSKSFPLKLEMLCERCVCVCEGVSASVVRGVWLSRCMRFKIVFFCFFSAFWGFLSLVVKRLSLNLRA